MTTKEKYKNLIDQNKQEMLKEVLELLDQNSSLSQLDAFLHLTDILTKYFTIAAIISTTMEVFFSLDEDPEEFDDIHQQLCLELPWYAALVHIAEHLVDYQFLATSTLQIDPNNLLSTPPQSPNERIIMRRVNKLLESLKQEQIKKRQQIDNIGIPNVLVMIQASCQREYFSTITDRSSRRQFAKQLTEITVIFNSLTSPQPS